MGGKKVFLDKYSFCKVPITRAPGCSFNKERKKKEYGFTLYTIYKLKCKLFCHCVGNIDFFSSQSKMNSTFCVVLTKTKANKQTNKTPLSLP